MSPEFFAVLAGPLLILQLSSAIAVCPDRSSATAAAQEMNFTLEGKITSLSPGKLTVASEENMLFHVRYDDKTEIKKPDGSPGTAKDLRVGLQVAIAGDLAESGEITAKKIEIQAQSSEKKSGIGGPPHRQSGGIATAGRATAVYSQNSEVVE